MNEQIEDNEERLIKIQDESYLNTEHTMRENYHAL